jgi:hypothetical protein
MEAPPALVMGAESGSSLQTSDGGRVCCYGGYTLRSEIEAPLTVALIEFASSSLPAKLHLKKKSGGRKTRP